MGAPQTPDHGVNRLATLAAVLLFALPPGTARQTSSPVEAIVLGIAQDGGVPHAGCRQKLCLEARRDPAKRRLVASIGLIDAAAKKRFAIDATPDFAAQMERLGGLPDGILLTHAHIGHYLGLAQLGREVLNAKAMPVYCTAPMARFLRENRPWSRLVEQENISIHVIEPGAEFALTENLHVTALKVPHRDEDSDTVAYLVRGPHRRLLWLPDIDKWEQWDRRVEQFSADPQLTAFLDGTFFEADEIPGRSIAEIPHPLVPETTARILANGNPAAKIFFVHLNHTNRLLWDAAAVRDVEAKGFGVAREEQRVNLSGP
ncbi:MAG: MBL fold metallo-hydrolase [Thermoanaerobaculia bacterium]